MKKIFLLFLSILFISATPVYACTLGKQFQVNTLSGGTLTTDLVSYWNMQGNSNDYVGTNNGVDTTITYSTGNGIVGEGAGFNGSSSGIAIAQNSDLTPSTMSWSFWVKPNSLPSTGNLNNLIDKRDNTNGTNGYGIGLYNPSGTQTIIFASKNSDSWPSWSVTLSTSSWSNLVFIRSGTAVTLYINDVSQGASGMVTFTDFSTNLYFGNRSGNNFFYNGAMDEIGLWSKALSSQEISDLYNGGLGQTMVDITSCRRKIIVIP
jgi:hypothetical protein